MNETPILGLGPHTLHSKATVVSFLGGSLLVLMGLATMAGVSAMQMGSVDELMEETDAWENGTVAADGGIDGEVTTRQFVFDSYKLVVDWVDPLGQYHQKEQEFETLFGSIDDNEPVEVRYLPTDEGHTIATSWSESVRTSRWAAIAFLVLIGLLVGAGLIKVGVGIVHRALQSAATIKNFDEVWLRITDIVAMSNNGVVTHTYTLFDEEKKKEFTQAFKSGLALTGLGATHAFALRRRDGDFHLVLRSDLYPLVKDASASADILDRITQPRT